MELKLKWLRVNNTKFRLFREMITCCAFVEQTTSIKHLNILLIWDIYWGCFIRVCSKCIAFINVESADADNHIHRFMRNIIIPREQRSCWGVYWFHSVRPSVRLSRLPCPLCNIYSSGWILSILATNDHYHERVCRTQWPLTLTYIFKVIRPWLRKSCPLCSVYSSGWILFIFGTNDYYQ